MSFTTSHIFSLIHKEKERQQQGIELIASENYVSEKVLQAAGSILTNKYAEGYPHKRYYGGCEVVDEVEIAAIENAKKIFDCTYANVQPHSGSQANSSVLSALLQPHDTILGLDLSMGGHLTHGSPVNFSGRTYRSVFYGLKKTDFRIDYDDMEQKAIAEKPKVIICGASSYARDWDYKRIRYIADKVGAVVLADIAHTAGLIAKKLLNDPFDECHIITTTTHKTLRGPRGGMILMRKDFDNPLGLTFKKNNKLKPMSQLLDSAVFPGNQGGPLMHIIAAKAVAFSEILTESFTQYAKQVITNAQTLASSLQAKGFTVVSGGTDNHIILVNTLNKGINGKEAEHLLGKVDITVNKNMIPFDENPPTITSGIRLGSPAITSRGLKEKEIQQVAHFIDQAISNKDDEQQLARIQKEVNAFMYPFPIHPLG